MVSKNSNKRTHSQNIIKFIQFLLETLLDTLLDGLYSTYEKIMYINDFKEYLAGHVIEEEENIHANL